MYPVTRPGGDGDWDASPPYVPVRSSGWPARRPPRLAYAAIAVLAAAAVLVALAHRPSTAQRAADMRAFLTDMRADIGSCAADVTASLQALRAIEAGTSTDVRAARLVAASGASDCSPANDELIGDMIQYQVTESLASLRLGRVVDGLVAWAVPDAVRVQGDIARVLARRGSQAETGAQAALHGALRTLDAQRAAVDSAVAAASATLSAGASAPPLPG